ncbi:conjugal transfer protein TrbD [Desulfovibrio sp. JC010]|nr:conjugal transfer protein TrbD [Desulfovibrio sp. JC010]
MSINEDMIVRRIPVHRSLHRHALVMGAEREPVMTAGLISIILVLVGKDFLSTGVAIVFWFFSVFILRIWSEDDPQKTKVWFRRNGYQNVYPAKATPWSR